MLLAGRTGFSGERWIAVFAQMPKPEQAKYIVGAIVVIVGFAWFGTTLGKAQPKISFEKMPAADVPSKTDPVKEERLMVHVAGAVKKPGLYTLQPDSRVNDAIRAAGGAKPEADLDELNLAAKIKDGTQVYVKRKNEPKSSRVAAELPRRPRQLTGELPVIVDMPPEYEGGAGGPTYDQMTVEPTEGEKETRKEPPVRRAPRATQGLVSINEASKEELESVPGLGPILADQIVTYREKWGPFPAIEHLVAVRDISPEKLKAIRKYIRL